MATLAAETPEAVPIIVPGLPELETCKGFSGRL